MSKTSLNPDPLEAIDEIFDIPTVIRLAKRISSGVEATDNNIEIKVVFYDGAVDTYPFTLSYDLIKANLLALLQQERKEAETKIFKDEITYGKNIIPKDWKKIEKVYIWFEAFNRGIKWRGIPGYVYEKPDGTFTAPFRGKLIDVIWDCKNEYRELLPNTEQEQL